MMYYDWNHHGGGPGWVILMLIGMILFWSALAFAVVAGVRHFSHSHRGSSVAHDTAVEILKTRFAKGEIDEADFKSRMTLLDGTK